MNIPKINGELDFTQLPAHEPTKEQVQQEDPGAQGVDQSLVSQMDESFPVEETTVEALPIEGAPEKVPVQVSCREEYRQKETSPPFI